MEPAEQRPQPTQASQVHRGGSGTPSSTERACSHGAALAELAHGIGHRHFGSFLLVPAAALLHATTPHHRRIRQHASPFLHFLPLVECLADFLDDFPDSLRRAKREPPRRPTQLHTIPSQTLRTATPAAASPTALKPPLHHVHLRLRTQPAAAAPASSSTTLLDLYAPVVGWSRGCGLSLPICLHQASSHSPRPHSTVLKHPLESGLATPHPWFRSPTATSTPHRRPPLRSEAPSPSSRPAHQAPAPTYPRGASVTTDHILAARLTCPRMSSPSSITRETSRSSSELDMSKIAISSTGTP